MKKIRFTSIINKLENRERNGETEIREEVKEEINELIVDAQTLQENIIVEEQNCILIPSYASRVVNKNGNTEWLAQVHGWAYGTKQNRKKKLLLGMAKRVAGLNKDDEKSIKLLEDRISMFLAKNLRNQQFRVQIVGLAHPSHMELDKDPSYVDDDDDIKSDDTGNSIYQGPSTHITINTVNTGHFCGEIGVPVEVVDEWVAKAQKEGHGDGNHVRLLKLEALPEGRKYAQPSYGSVNLIEDEGISIISDIDDTIKLTGIASGPRVVLSNTFLYDLHEVPGMADIYMDWYDKGASIHYVSNSPWQLFPMLKQFFHTKRFPPGSAHLKFYNDLVKSLLEEPGLSKSNYITEILKDFPKRKFILVGDSGENDMEIYSKIASKYPKQILHVFIRDVSTEILEKLPEPAGRSRSFPFIPTRSSSSKSIRSTKSMPPAVDTSKLSRVDTSICNISDSEEIQYSPEPLTPITPSDSVTPDLKTPMQKFLDRVEACKELVPKNAFTLFKDSRELTKNDIVNAEFESLLERQRQRPSRQNTYIERS